jgi:hypothetical protein
VYKSEVLYSALIKKSRLINNNTTRLTLPKDAILLSGLNSDFFEVRAYSDRIELRPHKFKFVGKSKETSNEEKKVSEIRLEKESVETKSPELESEHTLEPEKHSEDIPEEKDDTDRLLDSLDQEAIDIMRKQSF